MAIKTKYIQTSSHSYRCTYNVHIYYKYMPMSMSLRSSPLPRKKKKTRKFCHSRHQSTPSSSSSQGKNTVHNHFQPPNIFASMTTEIFSCDFWMCFLLFYVLVLHYIHAVVCARAIVDHLSSQLFAPAKTLTTCSYNANIWMHEQHMICISIHIIYLCTTITTMRTSTHTHTHPYIRGIESVRGRASLVVQECSESNVYLNHLAKMYNKSPYKERKEKKIMFFLFGCASSLLLSRFQFVQFVVASLMHTHYVARVIRCRRKEEKKKEM